MTDSLETVVENAQIAKLAGLLPRWLSEIPLYRPLAAMLPGFDFSAHFQRLPYMTKREIREGFPNNFLRDGTDLESLVDQGLIELEQTSGTSEPRAPLILGQGWWAQQELRALRLNRQVAHALDEFPDARRATINSPVCSGDVCYTGTPSKSERAVGNTLYVSLSRQPFFWSEMELARIASEIAEWEPLFLDADPVYAVVLALYCERYAIRFPSIRFILCSYEYVSVVHRQILTRVFGVPVYNLYGSTETGHLLMEDEGGRMVPSLDTAYLEVAEPDAKGIGPLVATTLSNEFMPLIRYRIGDLAECCGGSNPPTYRVHGRARDAFALSNGSRVTTLQLDDCFAGLDGVAHYQLVERAAQPWLLRFVADCTAPSESTLLTVQQRLELRMNAPVVFQKTDALMPESSGKFRLGYPASIVL
jgi:phenylacetate-CoA ligase